MLDLIWYAHFKDGSRICQYKPDGEEVKFQEVLDNKDELVVFELRHKNYSVGYFVDLISGTIHYGQVIPGDPTKYDTLEPRQDMLRNGDYQYRLIYFREIERSFNSSMQEVGTPKVLYFLGFQYTDENGKNHKRMMRIHADGRFCIN